MDVDPPVNSIRPKKRRPRLAVAVVVGLSMLAGAWGLKVYYLPQYRARQVAAEVRQLSADQQLRDGDIIFQTSRSAQSRAIQLATHSTYSHCGLVFRADTGNEWLVLEAVQPVKWTPLIPWIARGEGEHFVVKRLRANASPDADQLHTIKTDGERFLGKEYDLWFGWSDDRIYCSELVWKAYHQATGVELGKLQRLGDFDLSDPQVMRKLKERYGDKPPLDEPVISPARIFDSDLLQTVVER